MARLPSLSKGYWRGFWPWPGIDEAIEQYRHAHNGEDPEWIVMPLRLFMVFMKEERGWTRDEDMPDVVKYKGVKVCWKQSARNLCYVGRAE